MLKLLKKHLKGYRLITVLGPLFKLFETLIELFIPRIVASIVDVGIKNSDTGYIIKYSVFMLALYIFAFLCSIICQYYAAKSAYGFGTNLRRALYGHINHLPLSGVDHFQTPTLIMRLNLDIVNTQNTLNRFTRLITRAPFMLIGALIMAVSINPKLSLVFFGASFLLMLALLIVMNQSSPRLRRINKSHDQITLLSRENLSGARVVRAFDKQAEEDADFEKSSNLLKRQSISLNMITALSSPLTYLIVNAAVILIVYLGAFQIQSGMIGQGDIIALTNYLTYILNSMLILAMLVTLIAKAKTSSKRINDVFAFPVENADGDTTLPQIEDGQDALVFEDVSVAYRNNAGCSLKNISFRLKKGGTLGIIGSTGSGKTTLVSLVTKLYDYTGKIEFLGQDLRSLSPHAVRSAVSVAPQKAVLFAGTVRDNLLMSKPDATEDEIMDALRAAQCGFVQSSGAVVQRGGGNFSGGQRQRLCLARAMIKKPQLLILDDATSALDYSTEAEVKREINKLKGLTKIIVSQRAVSIKNSQIILVLEEGEAVGIGTHKELYDSCPIYREIVDIQGVTL